LRSGNYSLKLFDMKLKFHVMYNNLFSTQISLYPEIASF